MHNLIAKIIRVIGWTIIIIGVIAGFFAGFVVGGVMFIEYFFQDFSWSAALIVWISTALSGILLMGFSEIIELLDSIKRKINM